MAYRIDLNKNLSKELTRIGLEQIAACQTQLGRAESRDAGVHDTRKGFKRLRALMILTEPVLGAAIARRERHRYRDLGRLLAASRDHDAMLRSLENIDRQFDLGLSGPTASVARALRVAAAEHPSSDVAKRVRIGLDRAAKVMAMLDFSSADQNQISAAAAATYRECRQGLRRVRHDIDDETIHAWRGRVQRHWRHMRLLSNVWPAECDARVEAARQLSQQLGDHHDLAMLKAFVRAAGRGSLSRRDRDAVLQFVAIQQKQLYRSALPLGDLLFAETATAFEKRFLIYWRSGRKLWKKPAASEKNLPRDRGALLKSVQ